MQKRINKAVAIEQKPTAVQTNHRRVGAGNHSLVPVILIRQYWQTLPIIPHRPVRKTICSERLVWPMERGTRRQRMQQQPVQRDAERVGRKDGLEQPQTELLQKAPFWADWGLQTEALER